MHTALSDYLMHAKCGPIKSHMLGGFQIHDLFAHALWMCPITCYKCVVAIILCVFSHISFIIFCFVANTRNIAQLAAFKIWFYTLVWKWVAMFAMSLHHGGIFILRIIFLALRYFVYETSYHIVHCKLLYWYRLHGGEKKFRTTTTNFQDRSWQCFCYSWVPLNKQLVMRAPWPYWQTPTSHCFLHFARKTFTMNENDVG